MEKFKAHAKSDIHVEVAQKLLLARHPIEVTLSDAQRNEQGKNRATFLEVLATVRGLTRCGAALRGHSEDSGNLRHMLEERACTNLDIAGWLNRKVNFLSHDSQNELLSIMASMVQRQMVEEALDSRFVSVIADGTTDLSAKEQLSVCLRFVGDDLVPKELFMGLYECPNATAETLAKAVVDVLQRLLGGTDTLRGQCYDGASNMSGRISGVQARIGRMQPQAVYVHCSNHALDLALTEQARAVSLVSDVMVLVRDVSTCLNTGKRENMLKSHVLENSDDGGPSCHGRGPLKLLALCPTRWTVRGAAFQRLLEKYDAVCDTLEDLQGDKGVASDVKSKIRGQLRQLEMFETIFGMMMCSDIFTPCEMLAKQLQTPSWNLSDMMRGAEVLMTTLRDKRSERHFTDLLASTERFVDQLQTEIRPPRKPRTKRPPKKLEQQAEAAPPADLEPKSELRRTYFQALDVVLAELSRRFENPGVRKLRALEDLLLRSPPNTTASSITQVLGADSDVDAELLAAQLCVLRNSSFACNVSTVGALASKLHEQGSVVKGMLREVVTLVRLFLTVPVSAASAERSFSALRRVKSYLRSTMSQERLSHLLLLHVHQKAALKLDLNKVLAQFTRNRPEQRSRVFGDL